MNWGTKIVIAFVVFGIIMGILITISFNQEVNLVARDYYKQEIEYESQMDRIRNTSALPNPPEMTFDQQQKILSLSFPEELKDEFREGEIHFFRPSDYKMDKKVKVNLDPVGKQDFDLSGLKNGLWQVRLSWQSETLAYYKEQKIVI